jgi:hypothetical protein
VDKEAEKHEDGHVMIAKAVEAEVDPPPPVKTKKEKEANVNRAAQLTRWRGEVYDWWTYGMPLPDENPLAVMFRSHPQRGTGNESRM